MSPDELLGEFSIKIYEPPLTEMRGNGAICDLGNPIAIAMLIMDFETEVTMGGINTFLGNSTGRYARETVSALKVIGCEKQALQLQRIIDIALANGMSYEAIQADRGKLEPYAITSFSKLHGDKWDDAFEKIESLNSEINYEEIIDLAIDFVAQHRAEFETAIGHPS